MARKRSRGPRQAELADRHRLYEASVQCPEFELDFVDARFRELRGRALRKLREDFSGTAASACEWVRRSNRNHAWAVDLDAEVLDWSQRHHLPTLKPGQRRRLHLIQADVIQADTPPVDAILAFNFSYWLFSERKRMLKYFRRCRRNLVDDGVLFLDTFAGYEAHQSTTEKRKLDGFTYIWEQASYDPVSAEMECHIHFEFADGSRLDRAFEYRWRLWGIREIRELLAEAGFGRTRVYLQAFDEETDEPIDEYYPTESSDDHPSILGFIVAEK